MTRKLVPFDGELDKPKLVPFDGTLDGEKDGPAVPFKSGTLFEATKDLIPTEEDWERVKKRFKEFADDPMNWKADGKKVAEGEKGAKWAVGDVVGGLPGMVAGSAHGIYSGIKNTDATQGLKDGMETMDKYMPSTLLDADIKENPAYHGTMAPITAVMDTLNAVPILAGEGLNKAGYPNAAAQVTDAGKLGILAGMSVAGGKALVKGKGSNPRAPKQDLNKIIENLEKEADQITKEVLPESTMAHADDFATVNPYDMGGHVTKSDQGRPSVIDTAQGDLFGSEILEPAQRAPDLGEASIRNEPFPKPEVPKSAEETLLDIHSQKDTFNPAMADAMKQAEIERAFKEREAAVAAEKEAAFGKVDQAKERDYALMEAQKELQFADTVKDIEARSVARTAFLDRANLDFQHARDALGDKTLMRQEHTLAMREALAKGDTKGALRSILDNHTDLGYRDLSKYLIEQMDDLKVKLHDESVLKHGERDVTGYYDPSTHTVGLSGLGAVSPHTVLHEITHGLTSKFLNERPNDVRAMGIKHLYNTVMQGEGAKKFPGIVNIKEFVAEAFSNPEFQDFLKAVPMNNRSVWQRFVDGVKSMLGIHGDKMSNAFERAMDLGKQIVEAQKDNGEVLKQAGLSKNLRDLMATKPKDIQTNAEAVKKIPGLEHAVSDFAFYNKSAEEVVKLAMDAPDIPNTMLEKMAQQLQAGALFEVLKTRNPIIKDTYEHITRAFQEAAYNVKTKLTDPETGLKAYMRDLSPTEKANVWNVAMMFEGKKELTSAQLAEAGLNERQIAFYQRHRELDAELFKQINERRVSQGMAPIEARVAHIAGRFMGDFSRFVTDAEGKVVGRISGSTKWELERATKYMKEKHPEYEYKDVEYNHIGKGRSAGDRFAGVMEAINFLEKSNPDTKALMDSYRAYLQQDAVAYLNATRHAKHKVKESGGIVGSEGHKLWKDAEKNAEEGMKAQLAYYEQAYQWMAMNKATDRIKQVLSNEDVVKSHPNAVKYSQDYVHHAMGRNQGVISDALNSTLSHVGELFGVGHSNIMKVNNDVKHFMMQKFMGFGNIPFTITQLMQPFQTQPALMQLLRNRGMEFSALDAQVNATQTYIKAYIEKHGGQKLNAFERQAVEYAEKTGMLDVKMADHTRDINASRIKETYDKIADFNITMPERLTRGTAFLFYSHILKDAGIPAKDIFSAAENMTNMTMVNYHPIERPMGYAKLGWLGDLASTLSRYKHNQWSQLAFYTREGVRGGTPKSYAPLATMLGTSLVFGGLMGFYGFNEADAAYQLLSGKFGNPDTLTHHALKLPELISHGAFSTVGLDMTTRFSSANPIPNSIPEALVPYGKAVLDMADRTGAWVLDPMNSFKAKQMIKANTPQSMAGLWENGLFTEKQPDGSNLYMNPTEGPFVGEGRARRTDADMRLRAFGFRDIKESKEMTKAFADSQVEKGRANLAEKVIHKVKYEILGKRLSSQEQQALMEKAAKRYAELGGDPAKFTAEVVQWYENRQLSKGEQTAKRRANGGYTGAFNFREANK